MSQNTVGRIQVPVLVRQMAQRRPLLVSKFFSLHSMTLTVIWKLCATAIDITKETVKRREKLFALFQLTRQKCTNLQIKPVQTTKNG